MKKRSLSLLAALAVAGLPSVALAQPVGPEFQVNTYTTGSQNAAAVASDASGNFVVVWDSHDGQDGASARRLRPALRQAVGTSWGGEFQVNTYTTGLPGRALGRLGRERKLRRRLAVKRKQDGTRQATASSRSATTAAGERRGRPGVPGQQDSTDTEGNPARRQGRPRAERQIRRRLAKQQHYGNNSDYGIFGQRYASDGSLIGGEFQVNTFTTGLQLTPAVAMDDDGDFVVVWVQSTKTTGAPTAASPRSVSTATAGGAGGPKSSSTRTPQARSNLRRSPSTPTETSSSSGTALYQDGERRRYLRPALRQRREPCGRRVPGEHVYDVLTSSYPAVASDASGNFVVVWSSDSTRTEASFGVFGQRYDNGGNPVGSEFQVNTYTTDYPVQGPRSPRTRAETLWSSGKVMARTGAATASSASASRRVAKPRFRSKGMFTPQAACLLFRCTSHTAARKRSPCPGSYA